MKNYFVLDLENNLFMAMDVEHSIANFVSSNILNTKSIWYDQKTTEHIVNLKTNTISNLPTIVFLDDNGFSLQQEIVLKEQQYIRYSTGVRFAKGYEYLLMQCDRIEILYEHACSLELNDMHLYPSNRVAYIELYARTHSISTELAAKQLDLDYDNTNALILRRKEILWMYGNILKAVKNDREYNAWQTQVYDAIAGVGAL